MVWEEDSHLGSWVAICQGIEKLSNPHFKLCNKRKKMFKLVMIQRNKTL